MKTCFFLGIKPSASGCVQASFFTFWMSKIWKTVFWVHRTQTLVKIYNKIGWQIGKEAESDRKKWRNKQSTTIKGIKKLKKDKLIVCKNWGNLSEKIMSKRKHWACVVKCITQRKQEREREYIGREILHYDTPTHKKCIFSDLSIIGMILSVQ